ncbi:MAG: hypothetical protein RIG84_05905 [Roseovarius sp.]
MTSRKPSSKQGPKDHYVVSGLFGDDVNFGVYKAPIIPGVKCLFFSNSDVIGAYAQSQGWRFIKTFHPVIEDDRLETSLQSKWVKYLQFLDDNALAEYSLRPPQSVLYFDHKFYVTSEHVSNILNRESDASILIRKTPVVKESIQTEIEAALPYERYSRHMEPTKAFVNSFLAKGAKSDVTICNTGLIHYRNLSEAKELADRVYSSCQSLKQPECQIVWAVHAQSFADKIDVIEWNDPLVADIEWQDPEVYPADYMPQTGAVGAREPGHGIVVAGFHRSGTSSVAGMLHHSGISAGNDLLDAKEDNPKGYYESWGLVNLHDGLMTRKGVDWATSLEEKAPLSKDDLLKLRAYFDQRAEQADGAWCMKDPRLGRYVFEWKRAAPELKFMILYRSPNASALSLQTRSLREFAKHRGTLEIMRRFYDDPDLPLRLWVEHNEAYVAFCQAHPNDCLVIGHAAIMQGFDALKAASDKFGIDTPAQSASSFLDKSLLSRASPFHVVSADLHKRALDTWSALCAMDISCEDHAGAVQAVADQLILDTDGTLARAKLLERFANFALKQLETQHGAARSNFWHIRKLEAEIEKLNSEKGELHREKNQLLSHKAWLDQERDRLIAENGQLNAEKDQLIAEKTDLLEQRVQSVLRRFADNSGKRLSQKLKFKRDCSDLRQSNLFNASFYLERNPDVKTADLDALEHYVKFGAAEGRDPSPDFSTVNYLSMYEDVIEAGINPLLHYAKYGQKEGRSH